MASNSKKSQSEEKNLDPSGAPSKEAQDEALKEKSKSENEEAKKEEQSKDSSPTEDQSEVDPTDEEYSPYNDPAVPSSAVAEVITAELAGGGDSPTLDACRKAYKESQEG